MPSAMTLLQVTPEKEIEFPAGRLSSMCVKLRLKNISECPVAYKIKTTAPKNYLVRPSSGIIIPSELREIQIVLQPQTTVGGTITGDRFLVQAAEVESADQQLSKDFWTSISKAHVQDQRLSVVFRNDETASSGAVAGIAVPQSVFSASQTASTADSRRPAGPPPAPSNIGDFEAKYNEILQYCLGLEKEKNAMTKELDTSRQQLESQANRVNNATCRICGGNADASMMGAPAQSLLNATHAQGYELWQVIAMVVGVVIILKIFHFL